MRWAHPYGEAICRVIEAGSLADGVTGPHRVVLLRLRPRGQPDLLEQPDDEGHLHEPLVRGQGNDAGGSPYESAGERLDEDHRMAGVHLRGAVAARSRRQRPMEFGLTARALPDLAPSRPTPPFDCSSVGMTSCSCRARNRSVRRSEPMAPCLIHSFDDLVDCLQKAVEGQPPSQSITLSAALFAEAGRLAGLFGATALTVTQRDAATKLFTYDATSGAIVGNVKPLFARAQAAVRVRGEVKCTYDGAPVLELSATPVAGQQWTFAGNFAADFPDFQGFDPLLLAHAAVVHPRRRLLAPLVRRDHQELGTDVRGVRRPVDRQPRAARAVPRPGAGEGDRAARGACHARFPQSRPQRAAGLRRAEARIGRAAHRHPGRGRGRGRRGVDHRADRRRRPRRLPRPRRLGTLCSRRRTRGGSPASPRTPTPTRSPPGSRSWDGRSAPRSRCRPASTASRASISRPSSSASSPLPTSPRST